LSQFSGINLPAGRPANIEVQVIEGRREAINNTDFDFVIHHGSPDAFITELSYGGEDGEDELLPLLDYRDGSMWNSLPFDEEHNIYLELEASESETRLFQLPTNNPEYNTDVIFFSGYAEPTQRGTLPDDYGFKLMAALPTGLTIPLPPAVGGSIIQGAKSVNVYPNPANDVINIAATSYKGKGELFIFDAAGKRIMGAYTYNIDGTINIKDLDSGKYILLIKDTEENYITSFIKN
jgi:hypothetical protein